jgi:hypothetical protein
MKKNFDKSNYCRVISQVMLLATEKTFAYFASLRELFSLAKTQRYKLKTLVFKVQCVQIISQGKQFNTYFTLMKSQFKI